MLPVTSKVWKYFKRTEDSKNVKCQLCEVNSSYTGGTTNFVNSPWSRKFSGKETDDITRAIVDMVVFDNMPLQMVEGKKLLKKLMSIVAPNYNILSRNTIKSRIETPIRSCDFSSTKVTMVLQLSMYLFIFIYTFTEYPGTRSEKRPSNRVLKIDRFTSLV